ncbi:ABC transporter ATP-binding protein [Methylophilus sp. Q8]|uniref:ABC transporter ATP-binding protein n=1 Tax=Methylophilus sp. Q8 TaxID=1506586 RepID=UPI000645C6D2|nr:ABC transporter ATP-binding protein [Methylophilus sp. Q8]
MTNTAISIENLHKKYLLKHTTNKRYGSLRDDISDATRKILNKIRHPSMANSNAVNIEEFWALNGINLEIKEGEKLGIIGRNGAGKSTLLKVISRIIEPTKGRISLNGRVSSLLEVGTGFHPELSGRENIFLNGAILGMSKKEIRQKFDEIVDFAEVEKFLDTPVKHYSSGMYVRLAFAVASSLDPEILIIDEVLAVGDARFQKKCLGKMGDASKSGKTILFVSHSMPTIASLCDRAILLDRGKIVSDGLPSETILNYYNNGLTTPGMVTYLDKGPGDELVRLRSARVKRNDGLNQATNDIMVNEDVLLEMTFEVLQDSDVDFVPNYNCFTASGECAFYCHDTAKQKLKKGTYISTCLIPANFLNATTYFIGFAISSYYPNIRVHFYDENCLSFNVEDPIEGVITRPNTGIPIPGAIRPNLQWTFEKQ